MSKKHEELFLKELIRDVTSRLNGTHPMWNEFKLNQLPSKQIIVGTLCAQEEIIDSVEPEAVERSSKSAVRTSTITVGFLVKNFTKVKVTPRCSVYAGKREELPEDAKTKGSVRPPVAYKKYKIAESPLELTKNIKAASVVFDNVHKEIKDAGIAKQSWSAEIAVEVSQYTQVGNDLELVYVTFTNTTPKDASYETTLFEASMQIELADELIPFTFKYTYEGFSETYETELQCTNCSGQYNKANRVITTGDVKTFEQPRIEPKTDLQSLTGEAVQITFHDLAEKTKRFTILNKIEQELNSYAEFYKNNRPHHGHADHPKYVHLEEKFATVLKRFAEGVVCLRDNPAADRAFELLQKTFINSSKKYNTWRLFQIVFIVSLIPDVVYKRNFDTVELLHVNTGGGKSEAYFGLVIFNAFFDRLAGKQYGVTALTKFPLRMLSIQQLQRIAGAFMWAEEVRKQENIPGDPFSVAYFVGSSAEYPRHNINIVKAVEGEQTEGRIISECPICEPAGKVVLAVNGEDFTVVHKCLTCNRIFRLYFTDEEVYRKLPTFIVATVDKLSGVSLNRRYRTIFGGSLDHCPAGHGFMPRGDECEAKGKSCKLRGQKVNTPFNQGPTLIIQDEMHLISEGFGTINSHFETLIETMQTEFKGTGFKHIAMTATISGAENQIHQLYMKKARIFPGTAPTRKGVKDFFFTLEAESPHRIIVGLKPNVRENQFAIRQTLRHTLSFIEQVETNRSSYATKLGCSEDELRALLQYYKSYLSYHGKKDDVQLMHYYLRIESDEVLVATQDNGYSLNPIVLTSEESSDNIRKRVRYIENENTSETKKISTVFATSIVSHGVDIEKWNLMCFQGMPRSAAEYIQSLSRVGRKHVGGVFIWFYPTRIRDLSYYNNFTEYHEILEHHVAQVPISRWAKLGFHQTFNSVFCAGIINYFSEIEGRPLYKVEDVNAVFAKPSNREKLIKFLYKAYRTDSNEPGSAYFKLQIPTETEKRLNKLERYGDGTDKYFFPNALLGPDPYMANQSGMRGIQAKIVLHPMYKQKGYIDKYKQSGSQEEENETELH